MTSKPPCPTCGRPYRNIRILGQAGPMNPDDPPSPATQGAMSRAKKIREKIMSEAAERRAQILKKEGLG